MSRTIVAAIFMTAMLALTGTPSAARAAEPALAPYPGLEVLDTGVPFARFAQSLQAAITANAMGLVCAASASQGAAARGIKIRGNMVLGVFRNDLAVRMLAANVAAGIEAPLRLYLTENEDGNATLTYRLPSAVFAPYRSAELDRLGEELDDIFAKIIATARQG